MSIRVTDEDGDASTKRQHPLLVYLLAAGVSVGAGSATSAVSSTDVRTTVMEHARRLDTLDTADRERLTSLATLQADTRHQREAQAKLNDRLDELAKKLDRVLELLSGRRGRE